MAARKATTRKKTAKRKAAKKRATRKKAARKARPRSLAARTRKAIDDNLRDLERELPKNLKTMIHEIRTGVRELEDQLDKARAEGEARWEKLEKEIRKDADQMLKRFGLRASRKTAARKKARKKATRRKSSARKGARR